ncbi:hypothetical protein BD310DRAFT_127615 [Dichomitus squalens]|uniref:Uncharacterized protein n=1 Tax=Dichomitus squalens TaxID=114155 RepID=A0A4Q9PFV2_9APHY|nr:hypothetical protein BD310DRAFT_127615 [Dichomitus squalens]
MPISSLRIHTIQSALRLSLLGVETCVAGVHPQIIPTANRCEPFTSSLCSQVSFSSAKGLLIITACPSDLDIMSIAYTLPTDVLEGKTGGILDEMSSLRTLQSCPTRRRYILYTCH